MKTAALLRYNLWAVETATLAFAFLAFDWKVLVLVFLTIWWTKLHTKVASS